MGWSSDMFPRRRFYSRSGGTSTILVALLALACTLALFILSGVSPIGTSSEAREAHVIRVMASSGEWILPTRNGLLPSKPPLHHWIAAAIGVGVGSVTEVVARLPSVLAAGLILLLTGLLAAEIASKIFPSSGATSGNSISSTLPLFTLLILGTTYGFTYMATDARVDMTFSFFLLLACFVFLRRLIGLIDEPRAIINSFREQDFFWFYLCSGLAVLAKGPLGVVLPLAIVSAAAVPSFGWRAVVGAFLRPRWGWIVFLAVVVPWYFAAALKGSSSILSRQIVFENLNRFVGGEDVNSESVWFYFGSFARVAAPWSLLAGACFVGWVLGISKGPASSQREGRVAAVLRGFGAAFVAGFVLFSLASGKRHSYLLPLFPFLSIFLAVTIYRWYARCSLEAHARWRRAVRGLSVFGAALLLLFPLFPAVLFLWPSVGPAIGIPEEIFPLLAPFLVKTLMLIGTVAGAGALAFLMFGVAPRWQRAERAYWLLAFGTFCLMAVSITFGNAFKNELKSFPRVSSQIVALLGPRPLSVVRTKADEFFDPVLFYIRREATLIAPEAAMVPCSQGAGMVLARREFFDSFVAYASTHGVELGEFHVLHTLAWEIGLASELAGNDGDQIVLFSCEERSSRDEAESPIRLDQPREVLGA